MLADSKPEAVASTDARIGDLVFRRFSCNNLFADRC